MSQTSDIVDRLPYPKNLEDAATLAVEATFQEMGERGAFDEIGLPESAQIFGKACAYTALKQLCEAAIRETFPSAANELDRLRSEAADLQSTITRLTRELGEARRVIQKDALRLARARDAEAADIVAWMSTGQCHIIIDTQLASVDDYPSDIASAIARTIARHEHRKD